MRNLTIGKKIILGFGLLFVLLTVVAGIAYNAVNGAGDRLTLFSDSTQETNAAAALETSMQALKLQVNEFLATGTDASIVGYDEVKKTLDANLAQATELAADPARAAELARARDLLAQYETAFRELVVNHQARVKVEREVLVPESDRIASGLQQMLGKARTEGDMNAAFQLSNALKAFFECSSLVNGFLLTSDSTKAAAANEALAVTASELENLEKSQLELEKLDDSLRDDAKKELIASLKTAAAGYGEGLGQVMTGVQARNRILAERINRLAPEFTESVGRMKDSVTAFQAQLGERTRSAQARNEFIMLSVTGVGIVFGVLCAWIITRDVTGVITRIASRLASESDKANGSAAQVADASQAMARGATQQAAALEETSSSLHEMASMTTRNSESAQNAKSLANETRQTADAGAADMEEMKAAMDAIKGSSIEISKIIKTIDEIAFQTNILALNAAVEAARAGEAGLGFAVVADEVRNLAQRCAGAAKETAEKISASTGKSEQGARISEKMASNLAAIVEKTRQLDERIAEIARSSHEQSEGIGQLNSAVASMDKITQDNAALAQQSATSADELKSQAEQVRLAVGELMRMVRGGAEGAGRAVAATKAAGPEVSASPKVVTPVVRPFAAPVGRQRPEPAAADLSFHDMS
jgi:methyl-accepting chemotaxis protein